MKTWLYGFASEQAALERLANRLDVEMGLVRTHVFPDGEYLPRVGAASPTTILYRSLDNPNEKIVELLLTADALRRQGARRIVLVAPYLPYMRQDAVFKPGEPLSQHVVCSILDQAFDRIVTVDPHLHRAPSLEHLFRRARTNLVSAADALTPYLKTLSFNPLTVVVGPDEESEPWTRQISSPLGLQSTVLTKQRRSDRVVDVSLRAGAGVAGHPALLIDDICSTGATLGAATRVLRQAGAAGVTIFVTHALCSGDVLTQLEQAGADGFISTDSCPHQTNKVGLAEALASHLRDEIDT